MYLWRALDDEGEAVDVAVQQKRDMDAAVRLLKRLLHSQPVEPEPERAIGLVLTKRMSCL